MLIFVLLLTVAFVLWLGLGRPSASKSARARVRAMLRANVALVAAEKGLRWVQDAEPHAEGTIDGLSYRVFASDCGFEYDAGATFVATAARSGPAFVAWPRDAPDSVASFGREQETGDATFDARFMVLTEAREATLAALDESLRASLLSLGAPALVSRNGGIWLLLPAMPRDETFDLAVAVVARVVRAIARSVDGPYRAG
jgi:hypothetical protein